MARFTFDEETKHVNAPKWRVIWINFSPATAHARINIYASRLTLEVGLWRIYEHLQHHTLQEQTVLELLFEDVCQSRTATGQDQVYSDSTLAYYCSTNGLTCSSSCHGANASQSGSVWALNDSAMFVWGSISISCTTPFSTHGKLRCTAMPPG